MVVLVLDPLARLHEYELTVPCVIVPRASVGVTISHGVSGLSMLLVLMELALIFGSSSPSLDALTVLEVVFPLSFVHGLVRGINELSFSVFQSIVELTLVLIS